MDLQEKRGLENSRKRGETRYKIHRKEKKESVFLKILLLFTMNFLEVLLHLLLYVFL